MSTSPTIAALVPCYNEELSIASVVRDLRAAVPEMTIYVYDNSSTDRTSEVAREAGAVVRREERKGKGNVVRRAFADVEADIYVLIDGDDTYDAAALPEMIRTLQEGPYDHILGVRQETTNSAYRPGHALGNRGFNWLVGNIFGSEVSDMLSGYRVMSRRFVKSFPALSREFEIETELTVHAMSVRVPQAEVSVGFKDRPEGSESKLRTYHDGFRILNLIAQLVRHERPMLFYGIVATLLALVGILVGIPVIADFVTTGLVPRLPSAILAIGVVLAGGLAAVIGLILDGVLKARREVSRLNYLTYSAPPSV
ncbi:glycosyl transferase [Microbacterium sp. HMWF026]|uniref:glycosyltransferase family 2 protein n=1 Tax=Microbacterium sp. HMWF026 TaxID=2056861 RepID=UPI000D349D01|nr:glycosyltransferase family 2 protein [Microbacterium sp. HMWF026]PTT18307.1 glycosyl transferase [Microbacterium sp. HMWF026]